MFRITIVCLALLICGCRTNHCEYENDSQYVVGIYDAERKKIGECTFPAGPVWTNRRSYVGGEHHNLSSGISVEEPYTISFGEALNE